MKVFAILFVLYCLPNLSITEENATEIQEPKELKQIDHDLNQISLIGDELSQDLSKPSKLRPPLPGQTAREPAASVINLIRSFFHLLESVTGQARIDGDEVNQIVKEINRLLYTATRMIHGDPEGGRHHRKARTFMSFPDPHYNRIREIVQRVMVKRGITPIPSSPSTSACDCNQIKTPGNQVTSVTSPPLTSSILVSGSAAPASPTLMPGRKGKRLALEATDSLAHMSGPWKEGDGFLRENAVDSTPAPVDSTPAPVNPDVTPVEEDIVPSIEPVSNETEVPSTDAGLTVAPTTVPSVPWLPSNFTGPVPILPLGSSWVPSFDPLSNFVTIMREYTNAMVLLNQRMSNITAASSKIFQTSARIISGQLRTNDPTWVYGQPLVKATEGYVDVIRSLANQLHVLGEQFQNLRSHILPSFG